MRSAGPASWSYYTNGSDLAKEKNGCGRPVGINAQIWRVKAHGIQVVKLWYLGRKEFLFLKELRDRFVGRLLSGRRGPGEAKKSDDLRNHRFISPIRDVLSPQIPNGSPDYQPSWMFETRDSLFWTWRRTGEYFRDLFGVDHAKEAYELMRS